MPKLDKAVALYFDANEIGEADGAHCGKCMMFHDKQCDVVMGPIDGDKGICGLYVHGPHHGAGMAGMMHKKTAGYIEGGPTHCGNCSYYGGGEKATGSCSKLEGTVEFKGCCNLWEINPSKSLDRYLKSIGNE